MSGRQSTKCSVQWLARIEAYPRSMTAVNLNSADRLATNNQPIPGDPDEHRRRKEDR